ncbi:potassium channel family protein [Mesoaciditoga sp.]
MSKQYVVIGLGEFGKNLAKYLQDMGNEVLAIDGADEIVQELSSDLTYVVKADATSQEALEALGVKNFDVAIVSVGGKDVQASILISLILKDMKIPTIIARASTELHGRVLEKIGVNLVVYPEKEMALSLAKKLTMPNVVEKATVAGNYKIYEVKTPASFDGKSLQELKLNKRYEMTVMLVKGADEKIEFPSAQTILRKDDTMIVLSTDEGMKTFSEENNGDI